MEGAAAHRGRQGTLRKGAPGCAGHGSVLLGAPVGGASDPAHADRDASKSKEPIRNTQEHGNCRVPGARAMQHGLLPAV